MPKFPFSELNIILPQRRFRNKGFEKKENTGIDTETYKGYTKLLCDSSGRSKLISSFEDILNFLTNNYFRNKFNFFFNIQYDFDGMIKYLDRETLFTLYNNHKLTYNNFKIFYIPKKFFSIKDFNNHHYYFYDINNFLDSSLNKASKKYLGKEKLDIIDPKKLNIDLEYWNKNLESIIHYCINDAILTKELSDYFWNLMYNNLNYYPKRPFSKGRLAEEYFLHKCYIPTINNIPRLALNLSWNNYSGGRFEIFKRGYFNKVYTYDIKSAYPSIIADLFDYSRGHWEKVEKISKEKDLGFYKCIVTSNNLVFSPFMVKIGSLNVYPNGKFNQYLNNYEIDFIKKYFFDTCTIKVLNGIELNLIDEIKPYNEEVNFLYNWKEREKDEDIKYCIKIILNAYYGKKIQTISRKTGKLFNPIEATLITSKIRNKVLELALQNPEKIIGVSTDSVHSTEKLKVPDKPKLGEFANDFQGKGYYIMSDIYTLIGKERDKEGKLKRKDKFRGFTIKRDEDEDEDDTKLGYTLEYVLEELSKTNEIDFEYIKERPLHLGECLIHKKTKKIEDINIFKPIKKHVNINGDIKRIWNRDFKNAQDVLNNNISSLPISLSI